MRGKFIVIEGLDRTGKSTQCNELLRYFGNHQLKVKLFKFPDRSTNIGNMINQYLQNKTDMNDNAIHLLFSANRWELSKSINDLINDGVNIIADRYAYSGIAYSVAKGLPYEFCKSSDKGLPKPDKVIFLDLPPATTQKRDNFGEERYETLEIQSKVREAFVGIINDNRDDIIPIDVSDCNIETVHSKILSQIISIKVNEKLLNNLFM